jgi:hypothetical protein
LTTLAALAPAHAQDATFRDRAGRTIGTSRTDANGVTTFHDRAGRVTRPCPLSGKPDIEPTSSSDRVWTQSGHRLASAQPPKSATICASPHAIGE